PTDGPATFSFNFTDASGTNFGAGTMTIPPSGQIARFITEAPFSPGAPIQNARTLTFTSSVPVAIAAIRGYTNELGQFLMTTVPIVPVGSGGSAPLYFPSFASGGGWKANLILVNSTDATLTGNVQFMNGQVLNSASYSVPSRSSVSISPPDGGQSVVAGW